MDARNTFRQHLIVGIFSLGLVCFFHYFLDVSWTVSFARVSFILLFLVLIIGPIMRLKKPTESSTPFLTPWSWRGELGIWFTLMALVHFIILLTGRSLSSMIKLGGEGYGLTNLLGLIALFWALILTATSFGKVIVFLGIDLWKWLHSLTHVVFYLVSGHFIYFQFFSTYGGRSPDWFGYLAVAMVIIVVVLQLIALLLMITKHREEVVHPDKKLLKR
ncbi:MAG: ferric reductase-like transmembrane domain-containing protein [Nanoarchaeota archaeon]|nr:ferric reductase-like transmembrane domain-containing protein [Nanoarchaeota archaeon]